MGNLKIKISINFCSTFLGHFAVVCVAAGEGIFLRSQVLQESHIFSVLARQMAKNCKIPLGITDTHTETKSKKLP